jgi:hypothetical protein
MLTIGRLMPDYTPIKEEWLRVFTEIDPSIRQQFKARLDFSE